MSVQSKSYTSKKTGKTTTKYYAVVYNPKTDSVVWGPGREKKKDAKIDEAQLIEKLGKGEIIVKKDCPTFRSVAELWLKSSRSELEDSTWHVYDYYYHHFLDDLFGDQRINKITTTHIIRYKTECEYSDEKAAALKKNPDADILNYKPETLNKIINILCNIFNFAKDTLKIISASPMDGVKRCKVAAGKHTTWSEDQITYFLQLPFVAQNPYYAMLVLMFALGTRPGELCGLSESDLTPQHVLTLNRGLNKYGNTSDLKNMRSHRPLKLSEPLYDLIMEQLQRKRRRCLEARATDELTPEQDNNFLFVRPDGLPVKPDNLSKNFKSLLNKNNALCRELEEIHGTLPSKYQYLPDIRLYDSRHSFATNLIINGKKSKLISEIMGNSVKTMEHHYAHLAEQMHEETLEEYGAKIIPIKNKIS